MTTRKILDRVSGDRAQRITSRPARLRILLALPAAAAAAAVLAACGSSSGSSGGSSGSSSPVAASSSTLKTAKIGGATVLTNGKGFTLYSFAPDTATKSNCNGACAKYWPPVKGPATASGVKGTLATIKRSNGSTQATFDGHPLYTYVGDTAPGQAKGNGLNLSGGVWHEVTTSGSAPSGSSSSGSGGGGGY
jgi:predicted lipoprotein with Yx(FWY)xxD motif